MAMKYLGETLDLHAGGEDLMFPHHENEIAQSESATGKPFARHWMHVRFLLVEGRKMSKSEGNFFTLRDLLLRGYKASAIRFLLLSVPYRHQLNFTFDGLAESASAVERLRTFRQRIQHGPWPAGENAELLAQSHEAAQRVHRRARQRPQHRRSPRRHLRLSPPRQHRRRSRQAAAGQRPAHPRCAPLFDQVFNVIEDHDAEIARGALDWAGQEGKLTEAAAELQASLELSDADIESLIAERTQAKEDPQLRPRRRHPQ